jgi:hypothetical protein
LEKEPNMAIKTNFIGAAYFALLMSAFGALAQVRDPAAVTVQQSPEPIHLDTPPAIEVPIKQASSTAVAVPEDIGRPEKAGAADQAPMMAKAGSGVANAGVPEENSRVKELVDQLAALQAKIETLERKVEALGRTSREDRALTEALLQQVNALVRQRAQELQAAKLAGSTPNS